LNKNKQQSRQKVNHIIFKLPSVPHIRLHLHLKYTAYITETHISKRMNSKPVVFKVAVQTMQAF